MQKLTARWLRVSLKEDGIKYRVRITTPLGVKMEMWVRSSAEFFKRLSNHPHFKDVLKCADEDVSRTRSPMG